MAGTEEQEKWAPRSLFQRRVTEGKGLGVYSYFGHDRNGYQRFRHMQAVKALSQVAEQFSRNSVLDVGCATGVLTERIRTHFGFDRAVGLDFLPELINQGKELYPKVHFQTCDLPIILQPNASHDLVVASEVLYYLTAEGRRIAIDEIARVLRPDGVLLFTSALGNKYFSLDEAHFLINSRFDILLARVLYMSWYHQICKPFYRAARLAIRCGPGERQVAEARGKHLVSKPPISWLIRMIANMGVPLIMSSELPAVCNSVRMGRPTNLLIVAKLRTQ